MLNIPSTGRRLLAVVLVVVLLAGLSGCTARTNGRLSQPEAQTAADASVIRPDNVATLRQVAQWGLGRKTDVTVAGEAGLLAVAYSPDGDVLATSDATGQVHIWRAKNGRKQHTLDGLKNNVSNLEFSPDGSLLAAGGITGAVEIWETETWQPVHTLAAHRGRVNVVRFSDDGDLLVTGSEDGTVRVWEPVSD